MSLRSTLLLHDRLFIGGEWVLPEGATSLDVISPSTEEVIGQVPLGSSRDIERAVAAASVFTTNERRGLDTAARLCVGTVGVNKLGGDIAFPFGGYKASGVGRQYGPEGLFEFLEVKTIGLVGRRTSKDDLSVVA
jgi:acyl-CoA reductase-like NAD-dependent aldehyde dehydrogenase